MHYGKAVFVVVSCCAILTAAVPAVATAGVTTYELGEETALLNAEFYAGQVEDGSAGLGRMAYMPSMSHDGKTVAFFGAFKLGDTWQVAIFLVDFGDPSSWRRLTPYLTFPEGGVAPITWTLDDATLIVHLWKIPLATGEWQVFQPFGYTLHEPTMTSLPEDNWLVSRYGNEIVAIPLLPGGDPDLSREPAVVTDWGFTGDWPVVTADGSAVAFQDYFQSGDHGVYDTSDVYVLHSLSSIIEADKKPASQISTLAPTSFSDPRVAAIRTTETDNVACGASFSADNSLVFYSEDVNHKFQYTWFLDTLPDCDFDLMISRSDGVGEDIRLPRSGNQMFASATPGGTRLLYTHDEGGFPHVFASILVVKTEVTGEDVGDPADNDIITTDPQEVSDASGTVIEVPGTTLVDFPAGVPQVFTINTPIDPIAQPQLPFGVEGIPVVREFGPAGTTFDKPVTVTITYSDEEINGFDESHLRVFLYNEANGFYDREVTTITNRDLANNTISFTVDHFSRFGLGISSQTVPLTSLPVALVLLLAAYGYCLRRAH